MCTNGCLEEGSRPSRGLVLLVLSSGEWGGVSGEERGKGQTVLAQGGIFILKEAELLDGPFWRWDGEELLD